MRRGAGTTEKGVIAVKTTGLVVAVVAAFVCLALVAGASGPKEGEAARIEIDKLKSMLGSPDLILLDVRQPADWNKSNSKMKGAIREDPTVFDSWALKYPKDKTIVLYCA